MRRFLLCLMMCVLPFGLLYAKSGDFTLQFNHINAVREDGLPDFNSNDSAYCIAQYQSRFINELASVHYQIDSQHSYQTSQAHYLNQNIALYPEGLTDRYNFISDDVGSLHQQNVIRLIMSVDKNFKLAHGWVMFKTAKDFNCVFSGKASIE